MTTQAPAALRPARRLDRLRILHVSAGGAYGYARDVARRQDAAGHDVRLFGPRRDGDDGYRYELASVGGTATGKPLRGVVLARAAERAMDEALAAFVPDVVHVHDLSGPLSPAVLRPLAHRGTPAVLTAHDYLPACPTGRLLDHGTPCTACVRGGPAQALLRRCDDTVTASAAAMARGWLQRVRRAYEPVRVLLCPSWFVSDVLRSAGVYPDRIRMREGYVDTDRIAAAAGPGTGAVYVGPVRAEQGVEVLLDAWDRVPGGAHLHVVGDGPDRAALQQLAGEIAPGRVTFHGALDATRRYEIVRRTAVTVVPSLWHEIEPRAVLEAFACGRPVVASRMGALPELIDPGMDGALVPPGDPDALAAALRPLVADPERAAAMGRQAREKADRRFAPDNHLAALMDHYATARSKAATVRH